MTHTVVGLFDEKSEAKAAMAELVQNGFKQENIDLSNRRAGTAGTGSASTSGVTNRDRDDDSIGDRIANFFNGLFGEDPDEARKYTSVASDAQAILTIQADSKERAKKAAEILDRHDAIDVDERAQQFRSGTGRTGEARSAKTPNAGDRKDTTGKRVDIPVVEEDVQIGKRQVERGGVRVRSRVVERPIEERIRLREEHVVVDRHPVDREISGRELDNFREGEFEITEHAEEAVVSKRARVTEEVSIGKEVNEREEVVNETARKTDVDVEQIDDEHKRSRGANR
jgi:uncharacterized protein (TIGR02271 family)